MTRILRCKATLERNILGFVGIAPVNETLAGSVAQLTAPDAQVGRDAG